MRAHDPNRSDPWTVAEGQGPAPISEAWEDGYSPHHHPLPAWVGALLFLNACLILAVVAVAIWR
jgi:hypothetical protein